METAPSTGSLADLAGISPSYASEIVNNKRKPSRALAIHIFRVTGWRHASIETLSPEQMATLETVEPWVPRVVACSSCDLRAESPEIRSCTRTDCPMRANLAQAADQREAA